MRRPFLVGCLAIIGLLFLAGIVGAITGGGGGGGSAKKEEQPAVAPAADKKKKAEEKPEEKEEPQAQQGEIKPQAAEEKPKPESTYDVGQTAKVGNVQWEVADAYLTNQLKSSFGTQKRGRFVVVDFTFTNNRDEEVTLDPELHMILKDSRGREFGTDPDAFEFVPTNLFIFLEPVNPGVSKNGRAVYQVPADANGFTLTLDDVELMEEESAVFDLGNIEPPEQSQPQQAEEQARAAAESYYQAVEAEDWEYTYDNLDSQTQSAFSRDEWFAKNQAGADASPSTFTVQYVEMDDSSPSTLANVTVLVTGEDGSDSVRDTYFVYEDGSWKHRFSPEEYEIFASAPTGPSSPSPSALATASSSAPNPSPDPSPNRNDNASKPDASGAGGDINCDQVDGPVPVPPGDPNNLDGDGNGIGCEQE